MGKNAKYIIKALDLLQKDVEAKYRKLRRLRQLEEELKYDEWLEQVLEHSST